MRKYLAIGTMCGPSADLPSIAPRKIADEAPRKFNFSAGPGAVDETVMRQLQSEMCSFDDCGMGLVEMTHRDAGGPVQRSMVACCDQLRTLLEIPQTHEVLLMAGGAHQQFSALPLNLTSRSKPRGIYAVGGYWADRAMNEGARFCDAVPLSVFAAQDPANSGKIGFKDPSTWLEGVPDLDKCAFVHYCANETIHGNEILTDPDMGQCTCAPNPAHLQPCRCGKPVLVADFTSTLLSRRVDVSKYGLLYTSSGKNLGPAGVCVVIIRKDLLRPLDDPEALHPIPVMMSYGTMANTKPIANLHNTPNTFAIRAVELTTKKLLTTGGLTFYEQRSILRAKELYAAIDASLLFRNDVHETYRSRTSISLFVGCNGCEIPDYIKKKLEAEVIALGEEAGLCQLAGHPVAGGLRVCLYNAVPDDALRALLVFLRDFEAAALGTPEQDDNPLVGRVTRVILPAPTARLATRRSMEIDEERASVQVCA